MPYGDESTVAQWLGVASMAPSLVSIMKWVFQ
jgi:hypothetical protein